MSRIAIVLIWLRKDCSAVTALEYGLIAAVVASVMLVGATTLGTNISGLFTTLAGSV